MAAIVDGNCFANFIGYSFLPFYSKASLTNNGTFLSSVAKSLVLSCPAGTMLPSMTCPCYSFKGAKAAALMEVLMMPMTKSKSNTPFI